MIKFFKHLPLPENDNDTKLVKKLQQGDREAFAALYQKYLDKIYRYIFFRTGQIVKDAEDITEIVFMKALKNIADFKTKEGSFQAWLFCIAHNNIIDFYRQTRPYVNLDSELATEDNLEQKLDMKFDSMRLRTEMNKLTDIQKEVIVLRFIEDLSISEISNSIDKNEESIRAIQYRALKSLRRLMTTTTYE